MKQVTAYIYSIILLMACLSSSTHAQQGKEKIAVLELSGTLSKEERITLSDKLVNEIMATGQFKVIERSRVKDIIIEQGFQKSECTNSECAIEIGQLLGVSKIIFGNVGKIGSVYSISLRLVDVKTAEIIRTTSKDLRVSIEEILLTGIKEAARTLVTEEKPTKEHDSTEMEETRISPDKKIKILKITAISMFAASLGTAAGAIYFFADQQSIHDKYLAQTDKTMMDTYFENERTAYKRGWVCSGFTMALMPTAVVLFIKQIKKGKESYSNIGINIDLKKNAAGIEFAFNF